MPMSKCPYCGKFIPNIYAKHHRERMCRVRRGLDKKQPQRPLPPKDPYQTQFNSLPRSVKK